MLYLDTDGDLYTDIGTGLIMNLNSGKIIIQLNTTPVTNTYRLLEDALNRLLEDNNKRLIEQ